MRVSVCVCVYSESSELRIFFSVLSSLVPDPESDLGLLGSTRASCLIRADTSLSSPQPCDYIWVSLCHVAIDGYRGSLQDQWLVCAVGLHPTSNTETLCRCLPRILGELLKHNLSFFSIFKPSHVFVSQHPHTTSFQPDTLTNFLLLFGWSLSKCAPHMCIYYPNTSCLAVII
jgi:hypothetical protein